MGRGGRLTVVRVVAVAVGFTALAGIVAAHADAQRPAASSRPTAGPHAHDHDHPPVPAPYADADIPVHVWTDRRMLARGRDIYVAKCAVCHGENGKGAGPGAAALKPKPADLTDAHMVAEMPGNYWLWRVSEGGLAEPFRSKGSAMPAWKDELSLHDRWAVIAYAHTLSGHRGPHVASENPELAPRPKTVTGEGTVVALRPDKQQVVVEHGEIKGFMRAMTMGYAVASVSLLDTVKPGDAVRFTIDTEKRAITQLEPLTARTPGRE